MILGMSLASFTQLHVIISLVAIISEHRRGHRHVGGKAPAGLTALFLATTAATSVTGFMFPTSF